MEELKDKTPGRKESAPIRPAQKKNPLSLIMNRKVLFLVKIAVTLVILYLIFRRIDFSEVIKTALSIEIGVLLLLLLITILKFLTQYKNWEHCLRITAGYKPAKFEILKSHFIGLALRFLIPGGHASFAKVYFVTNKKKATLFSIGIERFMQTWTNLWFASWAGLIYFRQVSLYLRVGTVILITLIPLIVWWSSRILRREAWKSYFNRYIILVPSITLRQALFVLLTVLQYYIIISRFYDSPPMIFLISVPLILVANLIPVTYAGLGLRETFAIHIFRRYQIESQIAVTASLIIFILNSVLPALVGVVLILTTGKKSQK